VAINFSNTLYFKAWDVFARPITVTPTVSQPGAPAYTNRAYYDEKETDVLGEDGSVFSDRKVYIDIRIEEFTVLPMQGDGIDVPYHEGSPGGTYVVADLGGAGNAGGIISITLKEVVTNKPSNAQ
jgi:hypothetical protein